MPIYEYQCQACGHELEKIQKMSDALLTDCPDCNQAKLIKKISASGFRLTGTGWYATDFKNKPASKSEPSKGSSTASNDGKTESPKDNSTSKKEA